MTLPRHFLVATALGLWLTQAGAAQEPARLGLERAPLPPGPPSANQHMANTIADHLRQSGQLRRYTVDVLFHEGTRAQSVWEDTGKQPLQEPALVKRVVDTVSEWVLSNLQIDVFGDSKAQTEFVQKMSTELAEPRIARHCCFPAAQSRS